MKLDDDSTILRPACSFLLEIFNKAPRYFLRIYTSQELPTTSLPAGRHLYHYYQ